MSKMSKADQQTVDKQVERLYETFPLLFGDVVNKNLKKQNEELKKENEELKTVIATKDRETKKCLEYIIGNMVIWEAIMAFNSGISGLICKCKHCCNQFVVSFDEEKAPKECKVWRHVCSAMFLDEITYHCLTTRNGTIVRHPLKPAEYPPPSLFFGTREEHVSHLPYHLVFDQRGDPYNFAYGTKLTTCTSPTDKELMKLNEFLQTLREDALTAVFTTPLSR